MSAASKQTENDDVIMIEDEEQQLNDKNGSNSNSNSPSKKKQKKDKKKKDKKKKKKKKKKKQHRNLPPGYKRVQKELQLLLTKPPVGVCAIPDRGDLLKWIAIIDGPEGTPYHGGKFYIDVLFGENYPFEPPKVTFKTKIYHCNIKSSNGEICLDVLKDNYSPALTVEKILLSLCALLQCPNPDDPLVGDIAQVLLMDKEAHNKTAEEWTRRYAMNHLKKKDDVANDE